MTALTADLADPEETPMGTEQTTPPDPTPWSVHFRDGMWDVTCSDGSLGGRFPREGDARTFADVAGPGPMTIVSKTRLDRLAEAAQERDALSGLLRGMARRVGKHRVAFDDLRRHMSRAGMKLARELDEARAELARVRPVVDAARALIQSWDDGTWQTGPQGTGYVRDLYAALGGDAAATPQPAGEVS